MGFLLAVLLALAPAVPDEQLPAPVTSWTVPTAHTAGVLLGMRLSLSLLYPRSFDPTRLRENAAHFKEAYTRPPDYRPGEPLFKSDGDPWALNAVGHGLFGTEVYGRMRQCGHPPATALLWTTGVSVVWEYGVESFHKRPSAIDLMWTPIAGSLLGEGRFRLHRWLSQGGGATLGVLRHAFIWMLDPLGEAERRWLKTKC